MAPKLPTNQPIIHPTPLGAQSIKDLRALVIFHISFLCWGRWSGAPIENEALHAHGSSIPDADGILRVVDIEAKTRRAECHQSEAGPIPIVTYQPELTIAGRELIPACRCPLWAIRTQFALQRQGPLGLSGCHPGSHSHSAGTFGASLCHYKLLDLAQAMRWGFLALFRPSPHRCWF